MHPPLLRPHPSCHEEVKRLMACHEENPYGKFFGNCNDFKLALDKCFVVEKEEKRKKNMNKARRFDAEFQQELELRRRELEQEQAEKAGR
ncbi:unnamed protein product [Hapterophycus canaliculatus]